MQDKTKEFEHKLLEVRRTARVVAGGRRFSFRATVVVGNRAGKVGVGLGKGSDVQTAVGRGVARAERSALTVPIVRETIPHAAEATYAAAHVLLRPAKGRGIIAGGAMRAVCELAGIYHITGKVLSRTGNKVNVARATLKALAQLRVKDTKPALDHHTPIIKE